MKKQAILLAHFGTSHADTREKTIGAVERDVRAAFPDWEVRGAFTSGMILRILKKQGISLQSVPEALESLLAEGFERVVIQPTHMICGEEYDKLRAQAEPFREKFAAFSMGLPLLSSTEDMQEICRFYNKEFPREDGEALVLMGHGTTHFANAVYPAMSYIFSEMGFERIFVGAVEGYPDIDIVRKELKRLDVRKVTVTPLMLVAGDHAVNDMAGEEPDSWKSLLESDGYTVGTVVRGLGEYPQVRELYLAHLRQAMERE